ncbi:MAG: GTP cyclohydrolase IIa [Metallosphaera sp.]|uniref:GTP cyclohydrolase IIa n=1 Tax=Metallosphaera sp. TaxID=2020860 RepID=UPI00315E3B64
MKTLVVELYNYREWTEILGYDREWKIQTSQFSLLSSILWKASMIGGMLLPLRYDQFILTADGIPNSKLKEFLTFMSRLTPVNIRACLGYGKTPLAAQESGYNCIKQLEPGRFELSPFPDSLVSIAHYDLNDFTSLTNNTSTYRSFFEAQKFFMDILNYTYSLGGLAQYMGGDNVIVLLNPDAIDQIVANVENSKLIKVGIGIGKNAREALRNATKALTDIRSTRRETWKLLRE